MEGRSPKLTSVTRNPRRTSPATSSLQYVHTPPTVSAVIRICILQFLDRDRFLFLDVAVALFAESRRVIAVSALPRIIVRSSAKRLRVQRTSGERKHGDRFADPYPPGS